MKTIQDNHLAYWEDSCLTEDFLRWCGDDKYWQHVVAEWIGSSKYQSILDVGCGTGVMYEVLRQVEYEFLENYKGMDITPRWIELCKAKGIPSFVGDSRNLVGPSGDKIPDSSYDCVLCLDILNHQVEFENTLSEALRVAKKAVLVSFFKPFETPSRIVQRRENLVYHHFNKDEIERFLSMREHKYMWINHHDRIPNSSRPPHLLILA